MVGSSRTGAGAAAAPSAPSAAVGIHDLIRINPPAPDHHAAGSMTDALRIATVIRADDSDHADADDAADADPDDDADSDDHDRLPRRRAPPVRSPALRMSASAPSLPPSLPR